MTIDAETPYKSRSKLRADVWEIADERCEHPIRLHAVTDTQRPEFVACAAPATELAHIKPRGMGHTGYRDTVGNCIATCQYHVRSTDDLSHEAWMEIGMDRIGLADWVRRWRRQKGWDV